MYEAVCRQHGFNPSAALVGDELHIGDAIPMLQTAALLTAFDTRFFQDKQVSVLRLSKPSTQQLELIDKVCVFLKIGSVEIESEQILETYPHLLNVAATLTLSGTF